MKQCSDCGMEKDESEFQTYTQHGKSYTRNICKKCCYKYKVTWFKQLPSDKKAEYYGRNWNHRTCYIIKQHHEEMKNDPEHLTTEFIQKIVGRKC